MAGKRIVFTGGSGKAGRHAVAHLQAKGHKILEVSTSSRSICRASIRSSPI